MKNPIFIASLSYGRNFLFILMALLFGLPSLLDAQVIREFTQPAQTTFQRGAGSTLDFNINAQARTGNMGDMPDIKLAAVSFDDGGGSQSTNGRILFAVNSSPCENFGNDFEVIDIANDCGDNQPDIDSANDSGSFSLQIPANAPIGREYTIVLKAATNSGDSFEKTITLTVASASTIPTMTEWATFLFALLVLGLGLVTVFNFQHQLAGNMGGAAVAPRFQLPFEVEGYKRALKYALLLSAAGFAIIYIGWGEITGLDMFGMAASVALGAYLIHLVSFFKRA